MHIFISSKLRKIASATMVATALFSVSANVAAQTLISDMEHNSYSLMNTEWFTFNDATPGGKSVITPMTTASAPVTMTAGGANGTANGLKVDYTLSTGTLSYSPFVGFGMDMKANKTEYDLSGSTGISFYHKGGAVEFMAALSTNTPTNTNYYKLAVVAHADWTKVEILWSALKQDPTWGDKITWDPSKITKFQWQRSGSDKEVGTISLDEVVIEGKTFVTPPLTSLFGNTSSKDLISAYPNPLTNGNLSVKLQNVVVDGKIEIFDILGVIRFEGAVSNTNLINISSPNLENGLYVVKVSNGDNAVYTNLVVKK